MPAFFILKENKRVKRMGPPTKGRLGAGARPSPQRTPSQISRDLRGEALHCTVGETEAHLGRASPQVPQGQAEVRLPSMGAPSNQKRSQNPPGGHRWGPVAQPEQQKSARNPGDQRQRPGQERGMGSGAIRGREGVAPVQLPGNQSPQFSPGLHPALLALQHCSVEGPAGNQGKGVARTWGRLEVLSFFLLPRCLRNVPKLGVGKPGL